MDSLRILYFLHSRASPHLISQGPWNWAKAPHSVATSWSHGPSNPIFGPLGSQHGARDTLKSNGLQPHSIRFPHFPIKKKQLGVYPCFRPKVARDSPNALCSSRTNRDLAATARIGSDW